MPVSRRDLLVGMSLGLGDKATLPVPGQPVQARRLHADHILPASLPLVSVRDFGAVGDGLADDSRAVQNAYNSLTPKGGQLFFPRGRYRVGLELSSRLVHLCGEGRGATTLLPPSADEVVLRAIFREGSWGVVTIRDMTITGAGRKQGEGLRCGGDDRVPLDEYTGGISISGVSFDNLKACIVRPYGSIGIWVDRCQFGSADYHFWNKSQSVAADADAMHSGCLFVTRSHMQAFDRAMLYIDSPIESGQVVFENNIFELGQGFVIYINAFNDASGVPGIVFRSNWNEATATRQGVEIEGRSHSRARFLFARDTASAIRMDDTPVGDVELIGSGLETANCNLENLREVVADQRSTVTHTNARRFSGTTPGRTLSLAHPVNTRGLRTPWFRMAVFDFDTRLAGADTRLSVRSASAIRFADQPAKVTEPVAGSTSRIISLANGERTLFLPHADLEPAVWVVSLYAYRVLDGPGFMLDVNGTAGLSGAGAATSHSWEVLVNISENPTGRTQRVTFYHTALGASRIAFGGAAILTFSDLQGALDFANGTACRLMPGLAT